MTVKDKTGKIVNMKADTWRRRMDPPGRAGSCLSVLHLSVLHKHVGFVNVSNVKFFAADFTLFFPK